MDKSCEKKPKRAFLVLTLFFFLTSGLVSGASRAKDSTDSSSKDGSSRKSEKSDKKKEKDEETGKGAKSKDQLFLTEAEDSQGYNPEIFRCSECGYEQDEPGFCPDHDPAPLVLVLSKGRNPLEPAEVDGNEDILVDLPLTGINFKKTATVASGTAAPTPESGKPASPQQGTPQK